MKNTKELLKKIVITGISAAVLLTGCSGKIKDIDIHVLAESLNTGIAYSDELGQVDLDMANQIYNFSDTAIEEGDFYIGSGATAEEIAAVRCDTSEDADKAEAAFQSRVEEQKDSFRNYVPKEVEKLEKAVIIKKGKYVILSISDEDSAAKDIIKKAFQ